jgi:anion-transporting  ArsA/GET3 family ATPase
MRRFDGVTATRAHAASAPEDGSPTGRPAFGDARLHIVTGKGGTGKTTVAAALALALAGSGRRVLLCEIEGRQGIASVFDVAPLPYVERRIAIGTDGGEIWALAIDAEAALLEYLDMFYHLGRAGKALDKFGVTDFATTIAPGLRDVLLIGKVYEATRRRADGRSDGRSGDRAAGGRSTYDAVVLDAPPTGRIGRFLNVNTEVAGIAKVGPVRNQAVSIMRLLTSDQCQVHFVTTLEEMPVQETLDGIAEVSRIGLPVGMVVVNMHRQPVLAAVELRAAAAGTLDLDRVSASMAKAGLTADEAMLAGLAEQAAEHAARVDLESAQRKRLVAAKTPVLTLPLLAEGVDLGALYDFADHLRAEEE